MCGILYVASSRFELDDKLIAQALQFMGKRGPDHSSVHRGSGFAIGHTRLSIIDLSDAARQPFWDETRRYCIAFNGEIYNHAELRGRLAERGATLRTQSDTEVLLELLTRDGWRATLDKLHGMFAFVFVDTLTGDVVAARDHFGQKPLYFGALGGGLCIASDPLSVAALVGARAPDEASYSVYMSGFDEHGTFGINRPNASFFSGIHALPAGTALICSRGNVTTTRYFAPHQLIDADRLAASGKRDIEELVSELRELMRTAAARCLVSDVPVGMLLSGGIDSSLVYWYSSEQIERLDCYTKVSPGIETIPLDVIPKLLAIRPNNARFIVQRSGQYLNDLAAFIHASRAPARWGGGPPMSHLCRAARQDGTIVLLGGDCADEFFGGYEHYRDLFAANDPDNLGTLVSLNRSSPYYNRSRSEEYEAIQLGIRKEILECLDGEFDDAERYQQATLVHDTTSFLQSCNLLNSDAFSMMHSVELRNPLLDRDLVSFAINLPMSLKAARHSSGKYGKVLMRELAHRDIGDFSGQRKEGTRNFSMSVAKSYDWSSVDFAIRDIVGPIDVYSPRRLIRAINLEIFHRTFISGEPLPTPRMLDR